MSIIRNTVLSVRKKKESVVLNTLEIPNHKYDSIASVSVSTDTLTDASRYAPEISCFKNNMKPTAFLSTIYDFGKNDLIGFHNTGMVDYQTYLKDGDYDFDVQQEWIKSLSGKYPSMGAQTNPGGDGTISFWQEKLLGLRIAAGSNFTAYDLTGTLGNGTLTENNIYAWPLSSYDDPPVESEIISGINDVKISGGWFHHFTHWHRNDNTKQSNYNMFSIFRNAIGNDDVASVGVGDALEHMYIRDNFDIIKSEQSNNSVFITLKFNRAYTYLFNETIIQTPISLKVDLTGTNLEGVDISSIDADYIISKGSNVYVLECPIKSFTSEFVIRINKTTSPDYFDNISPSITNTNINGETITFTTDKLCKMVLFIVDRGGNDYDSTLLERSNTLSNTHQFTISAANQLKDIYAGVVNKFGVSALSSVIQLD